MASRKAKRYGQGGSGHKHTPNLARANGKASKKFPKVFSVEKRRLISA